MKLSDFDYSLPKELIAQEPLEKRDHARLMFLHRAHRTIFDHFFYQLPLLLNPGDVLVFNDSKVLPARIAFVFDKKVCELFFIRERLRDDDLWWEVLLRPSKIFPVNMAFKVNDDFVFKVMKRYDNGHFLIVLPKMGKKSSFKILKKLGTIPLPPYIHKPAPLNRYQTVYAFNPGSVAAPTAGLHFTKRLLKELEKKNIIREFITLHIGPGTFAPVRSENIEKHEMHEEAYNLDEDVCERLNRYKKEGRRIIAIGSTSCRVLETSAISGTLRAGAWMTNHFIYPGYSWGFVDGLITNFHVPKSTLIMLVSAFAGREFTLQAYQHAISERYRFYSFGDAMFII